MQIFKGGDIIEMIIAKFINILPMELRRFCFLVCIIQKTEAELHSVRVGQFSPWHWFPALNAQVYKYVLDNVYENIAA